MQATRAGIAIPRQPGRCRHAPDTPATRPSAPLGADGNLRPRTIRVTRPHEPKGRFRMSAISMLKRDHDTLKGLLRELETTTERGVKTRTELFARIRTELTVHEAIEEEIFYPTLKQHPRAREIVLEGYEEHNVVDTLMGELEALPVDDETWGAKAKVMIENIEHHIEEEEGEMFAKARQVFDAQELDELGDVMAERKAELLPAARAGRV
jgi:hemerythrin-like domain-containing protein